MNRSKNFLPKKILERFSAHARNVCTRAAALALAENGDPSAKISPRHILSAIAEEKGGLGANILKAHHLGEVSAIEKGGALLGSENPLHEARLSVSSRSIVKKAIFVASSFHHRYIGTEHLLYGAVLLAQKSGRKRRGGPEESELPEKFRAKASKLKQHIEEILASANRFPDLANMFELADESPRLLALQRSLLNDPAESEDAPSENTRKSVSPLSPRSHLASFTEDLTLKAERGELDPLVGREREVERLMHILSRRVKNNPVLIGEPGVGKTAIVQGLAARIAKGDVPENLLSKRILALDLGGVVAGTVFRGEFEARLKEIMREAKSKRIILFIDEIHTVVGAGSAAGSLDAANILKPALAQGLMQCIGATTIDEYRKHIEKDAALERRFQPILVKEPSVEESFEILSGVKTAYEKHHLLSISDEAIRAAAVLSERYIQDRFLPDKALDVLDEAAAYVRGKTITGGVAPQIHLMEKLRGEVMADKERAIEREEYEKALKLKKREEEIAKELAQLQNSKKHTDTTPKATLTEEDVRRTVAQMTGVPMEKLQDAEAKELKDLEKTLGGRIVGQDEAIREIARTLRRARAGLSNPARPLGSFIFLGPTGVGKTELAKALAEEVYHSKDALIKLDMSEFMEPHSVSKPIGAPPGYVGYEDEGKLTERVRRNPHSILLFDEIEKAHPQVFNILLQILEDGELTSSAGRKVNFKNTIIIMTSNVGTQEFTSAAAALGFADEAPKEEPEDVSASLEARFSEIKERALKELRDIMRPELLNRIDAIVVFRPLEKKAIERIAGLELAYLARRMTAQKKLTVSFGKSVPAFVAKKAFNPREGARPVRRAIESSIEDALAEKVIETSFTEGDSLQIDVVKGKISITKK